MSTFTEQMEMIKKELDDSKEQNSRLETSRKDNDETSQQLEVKVNRVIELEKLLEELQTTKAEQRKQLDDTVCKTFPENFRMTDAHPVCVFVCLLVCFLM